MPRYAAPQRPANLRAAGLAVAAGLALSLGGCVTGGDATGSIAATAPLPEDPAALRAYASMTTSASRGAVRVIPK